MLIRLHLFHSSIAFESQFRALSRLKGPVSSISGDCDNTGTPPLTPPDGFAYFDRTLTGLNFRTEEMANLQGCLRLPSTCPIGLELRHQSQLPERSPDGIIDTTPLMPRP